MIFFCVEENLVNKIEMENENKVSMMDVTVTGEVEIHLDPNVVKESIVNEWCKRKIRLIYDDGG